MEETLENKTGTERRLVELSQIELDESTQGRVHAESGVVTKYEGLIEEEGGKWPFPPVDLFEDSAGKLWLADGFHRSMAAIAAGLYEVPAKVKQGEKIDALKVALGANASHGLPRKPEDIRRCVEIASFEFSEMTDRQLAKIVKCGRTSVAKYRPEETKTGPKVAADGRVFDRDEEQPAAGMCDGLGGVFEDDGGYLEGGHEATPTGVIDSGSVKTGDPDAVAAYDVAYVELIDAPGIAEVEAWVENVPTWEELTTGSNIPVKRMANECGLPANMVRRDLVVDWCKSPEDHRDSMPRWDGFRLKPVSLEHAERERSRWAKEKGKEGQLHWLADFYRELSDCEIEPEELERLQVENFLKHIPNESQEFVRRMAVKKGELLEESTLAEWLTTEDGDWSVHWQRFLLLLLSTELMERGIEAMGARTQEIFR